MAIVATILAFRFSVVSLLRGVVTSPAMGTVPNDFEVGSCGYKEMLFRGKVYLCRDFRYITQDLDLLGLRGLRSILQWALSSDTPL